MIAIESANRFRAAIGERAVVGPFSKTEDPAMVEAIGRSGMDFIILDLEHGPNTIRSIQPLLRAAELARMTTLVRVSNLEQIARALDVGAAGVQVPQVASAEQVEAAVKAARYAPQGQRGVCRYVRAAGYSSMDRTEYFKLANQAIVVIQVEGAAAIEHLDEILQVPGVDVMFIGPYDLSQSLGCTGQVKHPKVVEAVERIAGRAGERGVTTGTFVESAEDAQFWRERGVRYLCYSVDVGILYQACTRIVAACRG